jgi:uncharacterized membrane protein YkvA (DUF1232 family)
MNDTFSSRYLAKSGQTSKGDEMIRILQRLRALKTDVYILYLALRHPQTPSSSKILVGLIVAYTLNPIDLVPDFIPFLGYVDEIILIPIFLSIAYRLIPANILDECRLLAAKHPVRKKLRLWTGAIIVLFILLVFTLYVVYWYYPQN